MKGRGKSRKKNKIKKTQLIVEQGTQAVRRKKTKSENKAPVTLTPADHVNTRRQSIKQGSLHKNKI